MLTTEQIQNLRQQILMELGLTILQLDKSMSRTLSRLRHLPAYRIPARDMLPQHHDMTAFHECLLSRKNRLENALMRIDSGRFGLCCACGASIAAARLESDPGISCCLNCETN